MAVADERPEFEQSDRPAKLRKIHNAQFSADTGAENQEALRSGQETTGQNVSKTTNNDEDRPSGPSENRGNLKNGTTGSEDPPMSKSKLKKLRKKAEWEAKRPEWKAHQKEKRVARKERQRAEKQILKATNPAALAPIKKPKAVQLPVSIVIDCDFDSFMNEKERSSLASQITRCYSDTGKSRNRAHLAICSFGGLLRQRFDTVLIAHKAWKGVRFFDEDFVATAEKAKEWMSDAKGGVLAGAFEKYTTLDDASQEALKNQGEVIYLSSEADEDLTELKPYSTYIIGGLVDKNREKGICHKRATERGLKTARLPIGEFMNMASRKVLATNHVNEIMLKWLECRDWGVAFDQVIPKRKGGTLKEVDGDGEDDDDDEQDTGDDVAAAEADAPSDADEDPADGVNDKEHGETPLSDTVNKHITAVEDPS